MIAWIFSDECMALSRTQKIALFNQISNLRADSSDEIKCWTEYKNIDIIIQAGNNLFVVENKLRSSQHSDQLNRYHEIISTDIQFGHISNVTYCYLTLIREQSLHHEWATLSYFDLLSKLEEITTVPVDNAHFVILVEYKATLQNLTQAMIEFLENKHLRYELLSRQSQQSDFGQYIESNNFLPIFQKATLIKVWEGLQQSFPFYTVEIGETHGTALMDILFREFELKDDNGQHRLFKTGIQFQGDVAKISFAAKRYQDSDPSWIPQAIYKWFEATSTRLGYRYNRPRSKSFLSISRKLITSPQIKNSSLELPIEKIVEYFTDEIYDAEKVLQEFHTILIGKNH